MQIPSDSPQFFDWRREHFPFFKRKICLTHASMSPLPARSAQAIADYALRLAGEGQFDYLHQHTYRDCKERIAQLLNNGARAEEIAFAGSTSHAIGLVATSYPWQAGDNCVVFDGDFPANVVTWKNLSHTHGVEIRVVPYKEARDWTVDDLAPFVDEKTRLVTLSAVSFLSGYALDVASFGRFCHQNGALLCVDGIQALGATHTDLSEADFVCADAHKWMLGPNGAAFAWFRGSILPRMRPQILGWLAIKGRDNWFSYGTEPIHSAERFEPGARNYLGIIGMEASLAVLQEVGMETVARRVADLRDYGAKKLLEVGCKLRWEPTGHNCSGIVSFQPPRGDIKRLNSKLDERFALSLRSERDGELWIRVSPHFMNCEADLDELADQIADESK